MDILVTGGAGQVGTELQRLTLPAGVSLHAPGRERLDIADEGSVAAALFERPFAAVINTAAYTAVDKAESDIANAWRLNALGPAILAAATARLGIPLVHVSTDYVFEGTADRPYREDDPVRPLSVYGASKEGGEQAVRSGNPRHAIVRTAWVVSPYRANFVKTMLRVGAERPALRVVDDQLGCPTAARDLAEALLTISVRLASDAGAPTGTYHFVNAGETTWCGLAREIFAQADLFKGEKPQVEAIPTSAYPTPARRPGNSRLSTAAITRDFGITPRPWQEALSDILVALGQRSAGSAAHQSNQKAASS